MRWWHTLRYCNQMVSGCSFRYLSSPVLIREWIGSALVYCSDHRLVNGFVLISLYFEFVITFCLEWIFVIHCCQLTSRISSISFWFKYRSYRYIYDTFLVWWACIDAMETAVCIILEFQTLSKFHYIESSSVGETTRSSSNAVAGSSTTSVLPEQSSTPHQNTGSVTATSTTLGIIIVLF